MTLAASDLALYALGLMILFLTPGPVWLALLARAISGGFQAAWPLALGVAIGDVVWPLLAVLGLSWLVSEYAVLMTALRWIACLFFLWLGWSAINRADDKISGDNRLTKPGAWAGFLAGVTAILGNPKAILFYLGVLPGFFDLTAVNVVDITAICVLSFAIPLCGNLILAAFVDRVRDWLETRGAVRRLNQTAGWLLIGVGLLLPFT